MNKSELAGIVAQEAGVSKAEASSVIDAVFTAIIGTVANAEEVSIAGFGKFTPKARDARNARNPRTGETVAVDATVSPKFSAAKAFKEHVASVAAANRKKRPAAKATSVKPAAKPAAAPVKQSAPAKRTGVAPASRAQAVAKPAPAAAAAPVKAAARRK